MSDIAIKVENVSKKYQIGENKNFPTLRDKLMELPNRLFKGPKKTKEFWALKDVSFEIKKGEVVGFIGRNGAGKSTMLKILARITEPTSGRITMYGRVASMLEVGTGFNPELTGRENIYLNGAIIGMTKKEISQKFNDIVEFSGVEKFLDTPVKHYSSGMYVRLAFAVAAHLDADILLVDEVLAVGDAEFQKKCLGKMSDLADSGRTVIFVSHNLGVVKDLCNKVIYMQNGTLISHGLTAFVLPKYLKSGLSNNLDGYRSLKDLSLRRNSTEKSLFRYSGISILNSKGKKTTIIKLSEPFSIIIDGVLSSNVNDLKIGMNINSQYGYPLFNTFNNYVKSTFKKGKLSYKINFDSNIFGPGVYTVGLGANATGIVDWIPEAIQISISDTDQKGNTVNKDYDGIVIYPCSWEKI